MKKALALVLALVLALSLGVTAFAASVTVKDVDVTVEDVTTGGATSAIKYLYTYEKATYGWTQNTYAITLADVKIKGEETPAFEGATKFQLTDVGGTEFASASIKDGVLTVKATAKALVEKGVREFSVVGLIISNDENGKTKIEKTKAVNFKFTFTPDYVGDVAVGVAIDLEMDEFVISADQFAELAKSNITINALNGEFSIATKVQKGQTAINFKYDTEVAEKIEDANEDAHILAVNFKGAQSFKGDAKITFSNAVGAWLSLGDVIDHTGDETVYVYTFDGEKLTLVDKQDAAKGDIVYTAPAGKALGSIYLSDKELKGAKAAESSSSSSGNKGNVDTGANDMVSVAVAMAVVSLAAAGAVAFKKASK